MLIMISKTSMSLFVMTNCEPELKEAPAPLRAASAALKTVAFPSASAAHEVPLKKAKKLFCAVTSKVTTSVSVFVAAGGVIATKGTRAVVSRSWVMLLSEGGEEEGMDVLAAEE